MLFTHLYVRMEILIMKKFKQTIFELYGIIYDWYKYGNYREMSKAEALLILFGKKSEK